MERSDVLVIGAGPAGLMLAIGLVRSGVTVGIVDRAPAGRGEPRAAVLWPRTQRLFDRLQLMQPIEACVPPIRRTTIWAGRRRLGVLRFGRDRGRCC
jgi:2-polyprenyl-6-methoxyphenol hydroxylase-like FAD-dependent oxidoreductase